MRIERVLLFAVIFTFITIIGFRIPSLAYQKTLGLTDKEIVERLTKLEEGQKALQKQMNAMQVQMDRRFDNVNKRLDDLNNRIDKLINIMIGIMSAFSVLVVALMGLVFWDRKTLINAAVRKVEVDSRLVKALRELSKEDEKLAKVMKTFGLL